LAPLKQKKRLATDDQRKISSPQSPISNKKRPLGNDLLSQGVTPQVPLALANLTAGFEMEPGVPSPHKSPRDLLKTKVLIKEQTKTNE
jgi:hypothetical protein